MASKRDVVTFLTAPARSGKSFYMVKTIVDELLPAGKGTIYTNLPLFIDKITEYCVKTHKMTEADVIDRLHVIPREVEASWRDASRPVYNDQGKKTGMSPLTGPWEYFADKPLADSTIIIDEIHNFCGTIGTPKAVADHWHKWLGELGHNQARFTCMSQAPEKVHACIKNEAQASFTVMNTAIVRDPYFKIEFGDWLELYCGLFSAEYRVFVFLQETRKVEGKKERGQRKMHLMGPPYFDFYDSFNAPISNTQTDNVKAFEHEYERHLRKGALWGRVSLAGWFVKSHLFEIAKVMAKVALVVAFIVFMLSGGAKWAIGRFMSSVSRVGPQQEQQPAATDDVPKKTTALTSKDNKKSASDGGAKNDRDEALQKEIESIREEIAVRQREIDAIRESLAKMNQIILLSPDEVRFAKGRSYRVGEVVDLEGENKGKSIEKIDYSGRRVYLSGGVVLYLRD